jgi:hypothetical protein
VGRNFRALIPAVIFPASVSPPSSRSPRVPRTQFQQHRRTPVVPLMPLPVNHPQICHEFPLGSLRALSGRFRQHCTGSARPPSLRTEPTPAIPRVRLHELESKFLSLAKNAVAVPLHPQPPVFLPSCASSCTFVSFTFFVDVTFSSGDYFCRQFFNRLS